MRIRTIITAAAALTALSAAKADCQIIYKQPGSSLLRFHYSDWSLKPTGGSKETLSQTATFLSGFIPIRDNFEARYEIVSGHNDLQTGANDAAMSGLGDLRLQVAHSFSQDRALLSAGLNLPTGKKELNVDDERSIIDFLARDYLTVPMRRYGEGFGLNLQAGAATTLGSLKCGLSAVYDHIGSYLPYEGYGKYDPGDALSLTATAEVASGKITYTGDIGFSLFGTDVFEGEDIYHQGGQFNARVTAARRGDRYTTSLGGQMILRGRNKRYNLTDGTIDSQLKQYGDEYDLFLRVAFLLGKSWNIGTMVGTRQIGASEEGLGRSSLLHCALDVSRDLSRLIGVDLGVMYHTGSADGGAIDVGGLQMYGGLKVSY